MTLLTSVSRRRRRQTSYIKVGKIKAKYASMYIQQTERKTIFSFSGQPHQHRAQTQIPINVQTEVIMSSPVPASSTHRGRLEPIPAVRGGRWRTGRAHNLINTEMKKTCLVAVQLPGTAGRESLIHTQRPIQHSSFAVQPPM